jgi:hypothetical protein
MSNQYGSKNNKIVGFKPREPKPNEVSNLVLNVTCPCCHKPFNFLVNQEAFELFIKEVK